MKTIGVIKVLMMTVMSLLLTGLMSQDIYTAVEQGDVQKIKQLVSDDPGILNQRNAEAFTPLNLAANLDKPEVAKVLLDLGADPYIGDNENSMPIHVAAISGSIPIVDMLIAHGVDVNIKDINNMTAFNFAVSRNKLEMARHLADCGADVKVTSFAGISALHFAAMSGNVELCEFILEMKVPIDSKTPQGIMPIHSACSFGHTDVVKYLISKGARIDAENDLGDQPLAFAQNRNTYDVAGYLIEKGADVNHRNSMGLTALHNVVGRGSVNIAELLIDHGANINASANDGRVPLVFASWARNSGEVTRFLILNGADVNPKSCTHEKSCTCGPNFTLPLHAAARSGLAEMTRILVSNGAKVNVYDNNGMTPLHLAVESGKPEIIEYLIDNGAFINIKEKKQGSTELHLAVAMGYGEIVDLLISKGSDLNVKDDCGKSPLDYAWNYHQQDIAYSLLAAGADDKNIAEHITGTSLLASAVRQGEASVWFLGHSGWAVKTANHFLIFDYCIDNWVDPPDDTSLASGFIIPDEIKDQNVTVFCSHSHGDHFTRDVFNWKSTIKNINYVYCWQPAVDQDYTYIPIHSSQTVDNMMIYAPSSTDAGGGYVVEVDGLVIYHMGDHANGADQLMDEFTEEIDIIASTEPKIDIMFGPIRGCSLGQPEQVKKGIYYSLDKLHPEVFVPMHTGSHTFLNKEFAQTAKKDGINTEIVYVMHRGDTFRYLNELTSD